MNTTTISPPVPPRPAARQPLPKGLHWSKRWMTDAGQPVEGLPGVQVPVDDEARIAGRLWACPTGVCDHTQWTFGPDDPAPCCPRHPEVLIPAPLSADDQDPVGGAQSRVATWAREAFARRRDRLMTATRARLDAAERAAADAARQTAADMRGHVPSLVAAGTVLAGGPTIVVPAGPEYAAAVGAALAVHGAVAAYVVAYLAAKARAQARMRTRGEPWNPRSRTARRTRARARHAAAGTVAAGGWLMVAAAAGVDPTTVSGGLALLLGCMLAWAVNDSHWRDLWATRARLRDLARRNAEAAAARAAAELEALATAAPAQAVEIDESDPAEVGQRMAARWAQLAGLDTVPFGFQMRRTRVVPDETRPVTARNVEGQQVRIGWEYIVQAEPGALVARPGMPSPLVGAREWLASVLEVDPATLSLVDRPDGQINRGLMMLTDTLPLGGIVEYKGRAGTRRNPDGSLFGHAGRTLLGDDAYGTLWIPGQAGGGGRYGVTGSGKTVVTQISLLNDLYAGIFSALWDGKNFMDFGEFIGVIPMGCTEEHRDVMRRSFWAEMQRRQQYLTMMEGRDRHGRLAPVEALWVPERDGPPTRWTIEEFHLNARDQQFITALTSLVRLQRSTAIMLEIATQGGGLADAGDSVLRDQLNQISMQIMRMGDASARLTGYRGDYMPSELPRIPGVMLMVEADAPAVPVRGAYVHRRDEDGSIYDHLFAASGEQILFPPELPAETVAVYEREGLMDLWRMGQGPGGKRRLLAESPEGRSGAVDPVPADASGTPVVSAADVVLAIVHLNPGCSRATVDNSDAWMQAMAGGKVPVPSTISRAAARLEKDGLLTRADNKWQVTEKGRSHAELMAVALLAAGPAKVESPSVPDSVAPVVDMSEAAVERAVERQMETARLVAEQHAGTGR
jgi:hypothetical protein